MIIEESDRGDSPRIRITTKVVFFSGMVGAIAQKIPIGRLLERQELVRKISGY